MADNTTLNTGSGGDVIGSDDIAGVKYQRVKLIHGADGTNDGDVASANPLPVDASGTTVTVDNGGTFATQATLQANDGVDIGDVDVTSVVPGTGATNLGKAEDAAHTTGDVGVMSLAVRQDSALDGPLSGADGDYEPLHTDGHRLLVAPGVVQLVDNFADHTSWAAVNDDAGNLASDGTNYLTPNSSTSFDKLDGTANTVYGLISKTLSTPLNILNGLTGAAFWQIVMNIPSLTNVQNVVLRAGTDASNYGEWKVDATQATAGEWATFRLPVTSQTSATGTGWGATAVDYFAVGLEFSAESDTLSSILVDAIIFNGAHLVESAAGDEVSGGTQQVNIKRFNNQTPAMNTGNATAGTQRVVLASDQPVVSVDDNSGSLTVDAANDGTLNVQIGDGTSTAAVHNLAANDALSVAVVDGSGNQVTSFGGGTQYAEDTAHNTGDLVTMAGVVQQSADSALSGDGDNSMLQVDATGYLKVHVKAGSSGGVDHTDDAAFTAATSSMVPAGGFFNDSTPDSVDEGDAGAIRMSANRNLYSTIRDAAGNERGVNVTAGNALTVDASATTQPVSAASLPLPTGAATAAGQLADGHNVTAAGDVAHDAADSGNPIKIGGKAYTTLPTAAGTGDRVDQTMSTQGGALIAGTDGTTPTNIAVNSSGQLEVDLSAQQGAAITVDGSGVTQPVSGTVAVSGVTGDVDLTPSHTRNEAFKESVALGGEFDDTTPVSATEGNVSPVRITSNRAMHVHLRGSTTGALDLNDGTTGADTLRVCIGDGTNGTVPISAATGSPANVQIGDGTNQASVTAGVGLNVAASGAVAHDAAWSDEPPVLSGAYATTTVPTAVADGDVSYLTCDDQGRLITAPHSPRDLVTQNTITLTNTTETTLISATAATFHDVTMLTASNTSSTAVRLDIRDATSGTVRFSMMLAADGGGFTLPFGVPMTQTAVNNNWTAQLSGAVTDVRVFMQTVDRI